MNTIACIYCRRVVPLVLVKNNACPNCGNNVRDPIQPPLLALPPMAVPLQPRRVDTARRVARPAKQDESLAAWITLFIIAVTVILFLFYVAKPSPPKQDIGSEGEAWTMSKQFVTDRLKSPGTASFGGLLSGDFQDPNECATKQPDGTYVVSGWVDSHNAFGGTVRSNFVVRLRYEGGGTWKMIGQPLLIQR